MVWIQVWILHVTTFLLISGDDDVPFTQLQRRKVRPHSTSLTSHLTSGEEYLDEASPPTFHVPSSISSEEDIGEEPPPLHSRKLKLFLTFPSSKSSGSSGTGGPLLPEGLKKPRETRRKRMTSLPRDRSSRGSSSQAVAGAGLSGDASAVNRLRRAKRAAYKSFKETRQRGKAEGMYSLLLPDDGLKPSVTTRTKTATSPQ
ncbi:uncharacterized protein LOC135203133 isoform X1 [Macrobrachium nipponense]|uniref:uncharacterized protein LOC135203133 isoform X1 n=1 Tax=Macrobrachium nipponense TaxID=159736 RepID=UPI0030C82F95